MAVIEALGEAYATLRKAGIAPGSFLEIMNTLFGSQVIANYGRIIAHEQFHASRISIAAGLKDVRFMLATADECGAPMPLASLIHNNLLSALAQGQGDLDWSSMTQVLARNAGLNSKS